MNPSDINDPCFNGKTTFFNVQPCTVIDGAQWCSVPGNSDLAKTFAGGTDVCAEFAAQQPKSIPDTGTATAPIGGLGFLFVVLGALLLHKTKRVSYTA